MYPKQEHDAGDYFGHDEPLPDADEGFVNGRKVLTKEELDDMDDERFHQNR